MIRQIFLAAPAIASIHAEEPILPVEAAALLPEAFMAPSVAKPEFGVIVEGGSGEADFPADRTGELGEKSV